MILASGYDDRVHVRAWDSRTDGIYEVTVTVDGKTVFSFKGTKGCRGLSVDADSIILTINPRSYGLEASTHDLHEIKISVKNLIGDTAEEEVPFVIWEG